MRILLTTIFCCITTWTFAQDKKNTLMIDPPASYNSILFEKEVYTLAWSNSNNGYYKQEYIRDKDKLDKFNKMITIDVLVTDLKAKDVVAKKIAQIEASKSKDPVANYQIIENEQTGEFLLDFLMSKDDLYEWNAYRYKTITTNKGNAVLLFAYTLRSFDGAELDLEHFFPYFKKNRSKLIEKVANYTLPTTTLKD